MRISLDILRRALVASALSILLSACAEMDEMIELKNYVQSAVNRQPSVIEPLPEFVSYDSFTYSAASFRSPFDVPVEISALLNNERHDQVKPDLDRPREPLENYAVGSLNMVGTLARGKEIWALVRDETGNITRITTGNYMGRNHGRVINISRSQIDLIEIVPSGNDGWIERPQTLVLQQL